MAMKSKFNQIIKNLLEALEAQEKQIKDLSRQLKDLQMNNEGQDSELKDCTDRIDVLESELSDLENLDYEVNNNESSLECLESRFTEFKDTSEKELTQIEAMIEGNETRFYALESKNPTAETINQIVKLLLEGEVI